MTSTRATSVFESMAGLCSNWRTAWRSPECAAVMSGVGLGLVLGAPERRLAFWPTCIGSEITRRRGSGDLGGPTARPAADGVGGTIGEAEPLLLAALVRVLSGVVHRASDKTASGATCSR